MLTVGPMLFFVAGLAALIVAERPDDYGSVSVKQPLQHLHSKILTGATAGDQDHGMRGGALIPRELAPPSKSSSLVEKTERLPFIGLRWPQQVVDKEFPTDRKKSPPGTPSEWNDPKHAADNEKEAGMPKLTWVSKDGLELKTPLPKLEELSELKDLGLGEEPKILHEKRTFPANIPQLRSTWKMPDNTHDPTGQERPEYYGTARASVAPDFEKARTYDWKGERGLLPFTELQGVKARDADDQTHGWWKIPRYASTQKGAEVFDEAQRKPLEGKKFSWFIPTISREEALRKAVHHIRMAARHSRWTTQAMINALYSQDDETAFLRNKLDQLDHGVDKLESDVWSELDMEDTVRMNFLRSERPEGEYDPEMGMPGGLGAQNGAVGARGHAAFGLHGDEVRRLFRPVGKDMYQNSAWEQETHKVLKFGNMNASGKHGNRIVRTAKGETQAGSVRPGSAGPYWEGQASGRYAPRPGAGNNPMAIVPYGGLSESDNAARQQASLRRQPTILPLPKDAGQ